MFDLVHDRVEFLGAEIGQNVAISPGNDHPESVEVMALQCGRRIQLSQWRFRSGKKGKDDGTMIKVETWTEAT